MAIDVDFMDSFSHYAFADILTKWTQKSASQLSLVAGAGSRGGTVLRGASAQQFLSKTIAASSATHVMGARVKFNSFPISSAPFFAFKDAGTYQVSLWINADGSMRICRGTPTIETAIAGNFGALATGTWYYIEFKATIDDAAGAGTVAVQVNGANVYTSSGALDTKNTANASANDFEVGTNSPSSSQECGFDLEDLYHGTGTTFAGDSIVGVLTPNGAGAHTDFTPSAGSNYQNVDDATPNGDTDYNSSSTVGHIDTYEMTDMAVTGATIHAVAVNNYIKKTDAGSRTVAGVAHSNTTDGLGTASAVSTSYAYLQTIFPLDPNGNIAWAAAAVNDADYGLKIVS